MTGSDYDTSALRAFAERLADAARVETLASFRIGLEATTKDQDRFDPVTEADRAAERAMRALIDAERPEDGILGEEYGAKPSQNGLTWVLDPIDGTRGYISGTPTWGVLIALQNSTGPIFGIIDQPYIGERFCGGFGHADFKGPHGTGPLATRQGKTLAEATLLSTFPEIGTEAERVAFQRVDGAVKLTRYGMDCYGYALLALGQVDLVIEAGLQAYDIAAPIAVVEAAGGIVTDWTGGPVHEGGRAVAAATPELHRAALERLAWD